MRIIVNRSLCDGNGLCAREAPDLFLLDDQDELHILKDSFGTDALEAAQRAVRACPKAALSISD